MSLPFPDQSDRKSRIKKLDPKWDQIFLSNDTETDQNNDPYLDQPVAYDPTPGSNWIMKHEHCMNLQGMIHHWQLN